ncbi:MAG: VWA domain-containing protein [Burkholderiales bacterium]|nr:VWA domain-containing protein [Burkholderiales bacterium]
MTFLWPSMLWALGGLPLLTAAYLALLARRRRHAVRLASIAIARQAAAGGARWRRHLPPLLMLAALALLITAAARPTAELTLPVAERTLLLAMDVSGSMRAEDVKPTRLAAAQAAAKAFVEHLPREVSVGVVSFAGTAALVQAPTTSRDDVLKAIDRFQLQRGTATGSGLILSLATLFPDDGIEVENITGQRRFPDSDIARPAPPPRPPVAPGSYTSAAIIMLTDGQRTSGPDPLDAARMAADRGVRVYTVGVGTAEGAVISFEGWRMRVRLDEETLEQIALLTHGEYFNAATAEDLEQVYRTLGARMVVERRETEVTALFAAAGALLVLLAAGLSLWWFGRVL